MTIEKNELQTLVRVRDNLEAIGGTLKDNAGTVIDVTSKTIKFRMININTGAVKIDNKNGNVDDGPNGKVSYAPSSSDMDTAGIYAGYFIIDDATDERFPYDGAKYVIKIVAETGR